MSWVGFAGEAHAQAPLAPSLSVDARFAPPQGIAREDLAGAATDIPSAVAVWGNRIYTVGEARDSAGDSNLGIVARRADGLHDTGFSGDGKLVLPIAPGTGKDVATDIVVLPDGRLRILASTDVDPAATTNIDVAIVGLNPDGSTDTTFGPVGSGRVIFAAAATTGSDTPTRLALGADGRLAVTGAANDGTKEDIFVSLRQPDGSPVAGFGTNGVRVLNRGGSGLNDRGVDVEFRPGGGLVVLAQVETNLDTQVNDYVAVLRAFDDTGAPDGRFNSGSADLVLPVGQPDTVPGGLMVYGDRLWVSGATKVGTDTDAFIARMNADGSGLESRRYDMRGTAIDPDQLVTSSASDLDVVPGIAPALVVTGSINYNSRPYWAAAGFNKIDGPLATAGFGDLLIPTDEYGAIVGVAASPDGWAAIAGSLVDTSQNFDTSFGTARLLLDFDKACDLELELVAPLEMTMPSTGRAPVTLRVVNEGTKTCTGALSVPAPYRLEGGATAFELAPGAAATTAGLQLVYDGPRLRDDQVEFRVTGPGDPNSQNNASSLKVLFAYCDLELEPAGGAARAPTEGSRLYELTVHNRGTITCSGVRVEVAAGGERAGGSDRFELRAGRSASADVRAVVEKPGRPGSRTTLSFEARADNGDALPGNNATVLSPKLVGVGDSNVRSTSARRFRGTARRGFGGAGDRQLAVRGVEVAVQRLGLGCKALASDSGRLRRVGAGKRCGRVWLHARGTRKWTLSLRRALPAGRYVIYSRAVIGSGFREGKFSARDRNKITFRVS